MTAGHTRKVELYGQTQWSIVYAYASNGRRIVRPMESGRTSPLLVRCVRDDGSIIKVVVKFSAFCDQQQENLAIEAFAACLAADLGLPIPEPLLVVIPDEWAAIVPDEERKKRIRASSSVAFGSKLVTGGYSVWTPDSQSAKPWWGRPLASSRSTLSF